MSNLIPMWMEKNAEKIAHRKSGMKTSHSNLELWICYNCFQEKILGKFGYETTSEYPELKRCEICGKEKYCDETVVLNRIQPF